MKKLYLCVILCLGIILRFIFLDKPEGLWNDEYVSYMISQKPLLDGFWQGVMSQCHMPFYYLYLKLSTILFGTNDYVLRLSSVIPGIMSIIAMYYAGKESNGKNTGFICALFCACSSFLIYYSQEVRLYSLLFLISACSLLYTLRILKNTCPKNVVGYVISNLFILFTHTIGFVYVFFNMLYVSKKLYKSFKKQIIFIWGSVVVVILAILPLVIKILTEKTFSQWWGHFTTSKVFFVFTDYFSPTLTNLTNSPDNFFYNPTLEFVIFCIVPALIAFGLIIRALFRKENRELFYIAMLTFTVLCAASISGKLVLLTKYSIEIYPILILLFALGASYIRIKTLKIGVLSIFFILSLGFIAGNPKAPQRIPRSEGHKIVGDILKNLNLKSGDYILFEYYAQDRFEKYFDFSKYNVLSINKGNFPEYLTQNGDYKKAYLSGHEFYKSTFSEQNNPYFANKLSDKITNKIIPGQNLAVVILDSVSFFGNQQMLSIVNSENYTKIPLFYLVFSHLKNQTVLNLMKTLEVEDFQTSGSWTVIKFTKLYK